VAGHPHLETWANAEPEDLMELRNNAGLENVRKLFNQHRDLARSDVRGGARPGPVPAQPYPTGRFYQSWTS
jgi:hypothetical protein